MTRPLETAAIVTVASLLIPGVAAAATITVDVTNDELNADADCSLREAVESANENEANTTGCTDGDATPALDTIVLTPGGSYSRSIPPDGTPNDNQDGDLDLRPPQGGPVAIQGGPITNLATIFGGGTDRVIDQLNGGSLTLTGVRITDGSLDGPIENGAGIRSSGSLTIVDSLVADNQADESDGGGISSVGALALLRTTVTENSAGGSGGGISHGTGPLSIEGSTIASNHAGTDVAASAEGGGGVRTTTDDVTITESAFEQNGVGGDDGSGGGLALAFSSTGTKSIADTTFVGNEASSSGGGLYIFLQSLSATVDLDTSRLEGNSAGGAGGGIRVVGGTLRVDGSAIRDNEASSTGLVDGGGLRVGGVGGASAIVTDSTIVDNEAKTTGSPTARGGGIAAIDGHFTLRRSSVVANSVDSNGAPGGQIGGGIFVAFGATGLIVNSTVSVNFTVEPVGPPLGGGGGGIGVQAAGIGIIHSSLYANQAAGSGPGDALAEAFDSGIYFAGSALDGLDPQSLCASDGGGDIVSAGYNVAAGTTCGLAGTGDEQNATGILQATANHGGIRAGPPGDKEAVPTNSLTSGSAAVNHVPLAACEDEDAAPIETDARAAPRPFGSACDAGAYERTGCLGKLVDASAVFGTEGNDVLAGTAGPDLLFPLAGADTAKGKGGADRLCGVGGKDTLKGGPGADRLDGGRGRDVCTGGPGQDKAKRCERKSGIP